jgi:hypothetical protein
VCPSNVWNSILCIIPIRINREDFTKALQSHFFYKKAKEMVTGCNEKTAKALSFGLKQKNMDNCPTHFHSMFIER